MNAPDSKEKLWQLIQDNRFPMFTTRSADGSLHSRPLTRQNRDADQGDVLWFFVSRTSETFAELQGDEHVSVAFADPAKDVYVAISGDAQPVDDVEQKHRLWSTMNEAWFPNGPDDADVALLRVTIYEAEYWDVRENKLVQLIKMARAAVTQHPPENMGEHRKVQMH